ncbi:MAG: hypothetical protein DRO12_05030 [Thermoprotei archaeon]|nr:MAG: hypothetical protein DRO12_05030 [Thermoprotei archaeon]
MINCRIELADIEETGALYIKLSDSETDHSIHDEVEVILDIDSDGKCVGIEILLTNREMIDSIRRVIGSEE